MPHYERICFVSQAWTRASDLATAYSLGRTEAAAAEMLLYQVHPDVTERLATFVRPGRL